MVSMFLKLAVICASAFSAAQAQSVGQYFRPTGAQVSGVANSRAQYLRSPCPALNALANHGYIARDGRNLTPQLLFNVLMQVFNVDAATARFQTDPLPRRFTLADMSQHNFIEHDASLVHSDTFYRQNPSQIDGGLANDLLGRANNGWFGIAEIGAAFRVRLIWCQQKRGGCDFGQDQVDITFGEGATLLQVFGGNNGAKISAQHLYSFMVLEQFPSDWRRPATTVTLKELDAISAQIKAAAGM